jgi:hypothetical protein
MLIRHRILTAKKELINNPINISVLYYDVSTHPNYLDTRLLATAAYSVKTDVSCSMYYSVGNTGTVTISTGQYQAVKYIADTLSNRCFWFYLTPEKDSIYVYIKGSETFSKYSDI